MARGEPADLDGDGKQETFVGEARRHTTHDSRIVVHSDVRGSSLLVMDINEDGRFDLIRVDAVGPPSAQLELSDSNLDGCFERREIRIDSLDLLTAHRATDTDEDCDGVFTRVEEWTESTTTE